MFLISLKQICNEYLIKISENQSAPNMENRKSSPCSPCAPNLLHVLVSYAALVLSHHKAVFDVIGSEEGIDAFIYGKSEDLVS